MTTFQTYHGMLMSSRFSDVISPERIEAIDGMALTRRQPQAPWKAYQLSLREPLTKDDREPRGGFYRYKVLLRLDDATLLVCAADREVSTRLTSYEFAGAFHGLLKPLRIDVEQLVKDTVTVGGEYALSAVHVTVPASGKQLRSISYYGQNVIAATLFQSTLADVAPYAARLREIVTNRDVVVVRSTGQVAVPRESFGSGMPIEKAISYLRRHGYLRGVSRHE